MYSAINTIHLAKMVVKDGVKTFEYSVFYRRFSPGTFYHTPIKSIFLRRSNAIYNFFSTVTCNDAKVRLKIR